MTSQPVSSAVTSQSVASSVSPTRDGDEEISAAEIMKGKPSNQKLKVKKKRKVSEKSLHLQQEENLKLQKEALLLEIKNKNAMATLIQEATTFFEAANLGVSVIVQPASDPFLQQEMKITVVVLMIITKERMRSSFL